MEVSDFLNIISDVTNFNLAVFGISITVFTVLYAFILNRRDSIREMNQAIKSGQASPSLIQKTSFFVSHIEAWKKLNRHVKSTSILSIIFFNIGIFSKYLGSDEYKKYIAVVLLVFSLILLIYIVILLLLIFKNYNKAVSLK